MSGDDPKDREALRAELERYRAYFEASSSGIFVYGPSGALVDINAAACRMHGRTREQMLAMDPREFIAPESHAVFDEFRQAVMAGETFHGEAQGLREDGSRFSAAVEGRLITIGDQPYLFSSLIDISEQKMLADQLRHAQRMEAVGQLAGGVAHDFNNLLSVILGYAQLVSGRLSDAKLREDLSHVLSAGEQARELVQRLLAFSRKQTLKVEPVELNAFLHTEVAAIRRILHETVSITTLPNDNDIVVSIDRAQIEQVLINLAINAQYAMPAGGQLTFQLDRVVIDEAYGIRHHEVQHGAYALLSVSDTGVGMDEATRARIFEPFFTTKPRGEGTGLGLAMAYGIVKQHGGHLTVYSEPGSGTIFKVYLPEASSDVEDGDVPASLDSPGGSEHVMVVEDSADVRLLAERVLSDLGYQVITAANGREALHAADACERLDVLLTDVVLPGQNGKQVYMALCKKFPELCVVYMSGYSENVISHHGMLDPGVSMVQKPFTLHRLAEAVRAELDKCKTRS